MELNRSKLVSKSLLKFKNLREMESDLNKEKSALKSP